MATAANSIEEYGKAFGEYHTGNFERTWFSARSKVYGIKEIAAYLAECADEPQGDTRVQFEIDGDGTLHISTSRTDYPGEIETSDFHVLEELR